MFSFVRARSSSVKPRPRPELQLLLCCARTDLDEQIAGRITNLLQHDLDWAALLRLANRHQVSPLLYWHLKRSGSPAMPGTVLSRLEAQFYANLRHNLFLSTRLSDLLHLLQEEGVEAVPFKGPTLAAAAYGNLAFRQSADLDLLVAARDVVPARRLLMAHGYQPTFPTTSPAEIPDLLGWTFAQERAYLQTFCEQHFSGGDEPVTIDLHWGIAPDYFISLTLDQMLNRRQPVALPGTMVSTLAAEDLLLIVCAGGAKDCWARVNRICDVAEILRSSPAIDWDGLFDRARRLHAQRMLLLGLHLAQQLLGAPLPESIVQRIGFDAGTRRLASEVVARLYAQTPVGYMGVESFGHDLESTLFHLRVRDRNIDRARYCQQRVTTPNYRDWAVLPLPSALAPLYYLLRPVRVLRTHTPRLLRYLRAQVAARQVVRT